MNSKTGILYIVATPIGNLGDLSPRARAILEEVDLVLAEDTRQTGSLMAHFGIRTPMQPFHEHNERNREAAVLARLEAGDRVALVSDAGTPLISDPGYPLVHAARGRGIVVSPVPGPCAMVAALSASGLPTDRFVFEGFVPPKPGARGKLLERLVAEQRTVVLYESSHRIMKTLEAMEEMLPEDRGLVVGREISKKFETFYQGSAAEIRRVLGGGEHDLKGEFVLLVSPAPATEADETEVLRLLGLLLRELPLKPASRIAADWAGISRKRAYELGLDLDRKGRSTWE